MKSSHAPQQDRSVRTQAALIDALMDLLEDKPFSDITVAEIAAQAGLTTGAIYRRFKDKRGLLESAFARFVDQSADSQRQRAIEAHGKTDREIVEFMIRSTLKFSIPYLPLMRAASTLNDETSFEYMREARNSAAQWWAEQIRSSTLPTEELSSRVRFSMRIITAVIRDTLLAGPGAKAQQTGYRGKPIEHMIDELAEMVAGYLEVRD